MERKAEGRLGSEDDREEAADAHKLEQQGRMGRGEVGEGGGGGKLVEQEVEEEEGVGKKAWVCKQERAPPPPQAPVGSTTW